MYIDILCRWNARMNLTAVRDPEQIVTRHFGESLFAARLLFPGRECEVQLRVADIGSGAGFPGLPIKIWCPGISITLVESNHKKATFLRELGRALKLTNFDVNADRAENLPGGTFDLITLRAVERFVLVLPVAANLVAPGGRLALLIGKDQLLEAQSILSDLSAHSSSTRPIWLNPIEIPASARRILAVAESGENQGSQQ